MNSFLYKQIEAKVNDFFEGKSNDFVVACCQFLNYGGYMKGKPKMEEAEWNILHKEIIGEKALSSLILDSTDSGKMFRSLTLSERDYLDNIGRLFLSECYHRLKLSTLDKPLFPNIKTHDKKAVIYILEEAELINREQLEDIKDCCPAYLTHDEHKELIAEKKKRAKVFDRLKIQHPK